MHIRAQLVEAIADINERSFAWLRHKPFLCILLSSCPLYCYIINEPGHLSSILVFLLCRRVYLALLL